MHEGKKAWFDLVWVSFLTVRKLKTEEVEQMLEAFQRIQNLTPPIQAAWCEDGDIMTQHLGAGGLECRIILTQYHYL